MRYFRLYKILVIFRAYQLSELLPNHRISTRFKYIVACLFWVKKRTKNSDVGERLRFALQELGPVWIKFGQMLSTRQDLLPENIANQLIKLQDQVPPFDGEIAKQIVEDALQQPLEAIFIDFNITPLASASIAQVHTAILKRSGAKVIIKVLRPNLMPIIQADLTLMYWLAGLIECHIADSKRLRINDIINDYERTILNELNLLREAENTRRLRQNFLNSDILYIPYVYRDLCRQNVMVEERIYGIPISDIEQLKRNDVNLRLLAERGVQAFFTQVFRDNFFHADMHPGNIFVDASQPINPRYIGIDCAIVGELSREDQRYLAENFIAFFNRDYRKIAELYLSSGWIAEDTDILAFESSMRLVCDPIFAKPLGEISFAQVLFNLFKVARQYNMEIQPQLILLEKTLFYIEGLGRQLYPQLDLWSTAKPFLESWYQEQVSIKTVTQQGIDMLPQWRDLLIVLPNKIKVYEKNSQQMQFLLGQLMLQIQHTQKRQTRFFMATISVIIMAVVTLAVVFS